jgi:hypothetical protein
MKSRRGLAASSPTEVPLAGEFTHETDTLSTRIPGDGTTERQDLPVILIREADEPMVENRILLGSDHDNKIKSSPALRMDTDGVLTVGLAGTTVGKTKIENATSGSITQQPVTGALGTRVQTIPARDGQVTVGGLFDARVDKSAAYTVVTADRGVCIHATAGTWTLSLAAAATLGSGFAFPVFNSGSGVVTIDPDGSETIRDAAGSATTKTLAQGEGGIVFCDGSGFFLLKVGDSSGSTLASLGAILNTREAKSGAYTAVVGDKGKLLELSGTWTLALDPAATLGDNFTLAVFNAGSGVITIDPDGAETIRDAASSATTKTLAQGEGGFIICNGTSFLFLKIVAGGTPTAAGTSYSNTTSGLVATDVQEAIDELAAAALSLGDLLEDIKDFIPVAEVALTYVSDGDDNGVMFFLGSAYDTTSFSNPHTSAQIEVVPHDLQSGSTADMLVDRATSNFVVPSVAGNWVFIDLGAGRSLVPNRYLLRARNFNSAHPRNWKLQGTNLVAGNNTTDIPLATWTDLDVRTSDTTLNAADQWGLFDITGVTTGYRYFRILHTGVNSSGSDALCLGELEMYGAFSYTPTPAPAGFLYFDGSAITTKDSLVLGKTITAGATTGAQTINKASGSVNFAAAATSLVVTNSLVTANSVIICTVGTNDTTLKSVAAVAAAGSFTMHGNAAATAETRVNFLVTN